FLVLFLSPKFSGIQFIIFAPIFSFFFSHFLLLTKRKIIAEVQFLIVSIIMLGIGYYQYFSIEKKGNFYEKITLNHKVYTKNERIMVLGNQLAAYKNNTIATPFLNWKITRNYFGNLDEYSVIVNLKNSILTDKPTFILDYSTDNTAKKIFERMPFLKTHYQIVSSEPHSIYKIIESEKGTSAINALPKKN
ncbi:MAG: hypothetical protein AAGI07_05760, partial [Bacteroidota bacterium]